ncbi:IclR family transcriptional regulator C-terminal domain-containing protein [Streptomyces sp. TS71-3]|uniref:IclR family transcriptional regulator domain-containing protein n=1 Tax=Streptomyces sp. TS71-3 TaxID=2733862 RepID=UPI001AFF34E4|nr:IclR family transcriptional regulator C-terminal domain-containing protein [Streptomyces sp. TS71-3]GHJ41160.1 transcriptional regulator [Streptomyces sp. TS71-3]
MPLSASPDLVLPSEAVGPLVRGIGVLRALDAVAGRASLGELAQTTQSTRATVERVVATLARMDYVRLDGRDVVLAPGAMRLPNAYLSALRLPDLLGTALEGLAADLDVTATLAVADGVGMRLVAQAAARSRLVALSLPLGVRLPVASTAAGAVFAALWDGGQWERWRAETEKQEESGAGTESDMERFTERVRAAAEQGWALDDQWLEPGLVALAAPVRDRSGGPLGVVNLVGHTPRYSAAELREKGLPRLLSATRDMDEALLGTGLAPVPEGLGASPFEELDEQVPAEDFLRSLARGLAVLGSFGSERAEMSLSEAAGATGLARATTRRALITLESLGYVEARGRRFRPTPQVLDLGCAVLSRTSLSHLAQPHLTALCERVGDSVSLAVLDGDQVRYIARAAVTRIMSVHITVGTRLPAFATSLGRVLLAGLTPEARRALLGRSAPEPRTPHTVTDPGELAALVERAAQEGYAWVEEELEGGLRSLAVPVRDRSGMVTGAVNVAMHTSRRSVDQCRTEVLPALVDTASAIEADLHLVSRHARVPSA